MKVYTEKRDRSLSTIMQGFVEKLRLESAFRI